MARASVVVLGSVVGAWLFATAEEVGVTVGSLDRVEHSLRLRQNGWN